MKLTDLFERALTPDEATALLQSLGGRPDKFKYTGPAKRFVHWTEGESWDELSERLEQLNVGEFCVSSLHGDSVADMSGLIFEGKPRFHFPIDVHSVYNPADQLRYLITADALKDRQGSILYRHLHTNDPTSSIMGHDEAWCVMSEMKFIGIATQLYDKPIAELISQPNNGQLHSVAYLLEDFILESGHPVYNVGSNFIERITKTHLRLIAKRLATYGDEDEV